MFTRRSLLTTGAAGLALGACGPRDRTAGGAWRSLGETARRFDSTTIRVLGEDLPPLHSLQALSSQFTQVTGSALEVDFRNHSSVIQSVLAGALNRSYQYDIIFLPHKELGRLVEIEAIRPIDALVADGSLRDPSIDPQEQFFQNFWRQTATYNNSWYAVPLYLGGSIVVCRGDLVAAQQERQAFSRRYSGQQLRKPINTQEWLRLAEFFNRPSARPPMYGAALLLSEEALWYEWQSMLFAYGGNVLDTRNGWEYGDVVVNSPEAIAATEAYRAMSRFCPPDAASYSWGQGIARQQSGQNFMTLLQYDVVSEFENPEKTPLAGRFDYFLPVGPNGRKASQLESWVGVIPVSARAPEIAWLLLQWMMGPEVQLQMHLEGNISPRRSTYDDARVRQMRPTATILESVDVMVAKPTIPEASAMQQILTVRLQEAMSGRTPVRQALNAAAREIAARLNGRAQLRYPV